MCPPRTHYGKNMNFNGDIQALILCVCVTNLHETWYTHTIEGIITIIMIMYSDTSANEDNSFWNHIC